MSHLSMPRIAAVAVAALLTSSPTAAAADEEAEPAAAADDESDPAAVTWGVVPSTADGPDGRSAFVYELDPGDTMTDWLAVSNRSTDELTLAVYPHDAFTTDSGGFDLLPADAEPVGVGSWVTVDSGATVTVPARSRVDIPFELAVPDNATPGDHAGGLVAALASAAAEDTGDQVLVEHRVGARIYVRVSGELNPVFEIEQLDAGYSGTVNPFGAGSVTTTFTVHNTGNVRLSGLPGAEVSGPFGLAQRTAGGAALPEILPGDSYTTTVAVDGAVPLFRLQATVEVEPVGVEGQPFNGPYAPASHQVGVWAVPWSSVLLVLLVAGSVVALVLRRRRNRARLAAALAAAREEGAAEARNTAPKTEPATKVAEGEEPADRGAPTGTPLHAETAAGRETP